MAASVIFFFFTINLFCLINGEARQFYYIKIDLTVKLNDKETVNRSCFDQVSVRLSDAAHRNVNQKYIFFKKH